MVLLIDGLVGVAQFDQPNGWDIGIELGFVLLLNRVKGFFEMFMIDTDHDGRRTC